MLGKVLTPQSCVPSTLPALEKLCAHPFVGQMCKLRLRTAGDQAKLSAGDSGTELRTALCSSPKERPQAMTLHGLPSSQEGFPGQTGWLTCWLFIDVTSSLV